MIAKTCSSSIGVITERADFYSGVQQLAADSHDYSTCHFTHDEVTQLSVSDFPELAVCDLATSTDEALPAVFRLAGSPYVSSVIYLIDRQSPRSSASWMQILCRIGAKACLTTESSPAILFDTFARLAAGQTIIAPDLHGDFDWPASSDVDTSLASGPLSELTIRQIEILTLIAAGYSVRQVAGRLHLSPRTVESHKYQMMKTLDCSCVVELCRFAIRHGLIVP